MLFRPRQQIGPPTLLPAATTSRRRVTQDVVENLNAEMDRQSVHHATGSAAGTNVAPAELYRYAN